MSATEYPLCERANILRARWDGSLVVATMALWTLLGEKAYQECCKNFYYPKGYMYPHPKTVEDFLRAGKLSRDGKQWKRK